MDNLETSEIASESTDKPMTEERLSAWLRLSLEPGIGAVTAQQLLAVFGDPLTLYGASVSALTKHVSSALATQLKSPPSDEMAAQIERTLVWCGQHDRQGILLSDDPRYPAALKALASSGMPILLYYTGQLSALTKPMLSIVGARNATAEGTSNARAFGRYFAGRGWSVVSGLALGIDQAAHHGALSVEVVGSTIAVMATGIDVVYPEQHIPLAAKIRDQGLILSELPLGTRAARYRFPQRNRIVAGLSHGVLVVEAARSSGSLITARQALEFGREVFAIPGSIHSQLSRGCHQLIRQGAKLVERGKDIEEELIAQGLCVETSAPKDLNYLNSSAPTDAAPSQDLNDAHRILLDAMGYRPWAIEALSQELGQDYRVMMTLLGYLELKGYVRRDTEGRYTRA